MILMADHHLPTNIGLVELQFYGKLLIRQWISSILTIWWDVQNWS